MRLIGDRILERMKDLGMTQRQLAETVGVTEVSMSRYVNGQREPKAAIIGRMAKVLGTTSDYLLTGTIEQRRGIWKPGKDPDDSELDMFTCSLCGSSYVWQPRYCPWCGSKMEKQT